MADKITAFPVRFKRRRRTGTRATWALVSYGQLKELCKATKEHERGSHFFENLLEATFSVHTLIPHDIKNIISCLLSPVEYMLWERQWKKHLTTLLTTYANDPNRQHSTLEQIAREGNSQTQRSDKYPRGCAFSYFHSCRNITSPYSR